MGGVNDFFKEFKNESYLKTPNVYDSNHKKPSTLPSIELIIAESLKVKINGEWMNQLKEDYKKTQRTQKEKQKKTVKLAKVKK